MALILQLSSSIRKKMENIINLKLLKLSSGKKEDEVTKSITSPKTVSSEENKSEVLF